MRSQPNPFPLLPPHAHEAIMAFVAENPHGVSALEITRGVRGAHPDLTPSQIMAGIYGMAGKKMISHDGHVQTRMFRLKL